MIIEPQIPSNLRSIFVTAASVLFLSLSAPGAIQAADLTARGNEPGWRIDISDKGIVVHLQDSETFTIEPAPKAVTANGAATYTSVVAGRPFMLAIADKLCTDTMTGMPHPKTAIVEIKDHKLSGCAGEPAAMLHGDWRIEDIGGKAIITGSEPLLSFDSKGSLSGNASCNRFFGQFSVTGEGLRISETGTSRMMCDDRLMKQEQSLLTAFETVRHFQINSSRQLLLIGDKGQPLVRARR